MGAKTKIDWCDSTWNPVTGCLHGCNYCYARSIANRFSYIKDWEKYPSNIVLKEPVCDGITNKIQAYPYGFIPTFHKYRLNEYATKKSRNIFVCSMADLFGYWVPDSWIEEVFAACDKAPQHNYLFLTKNPYRYEVLHQRGILRKNQNMWYGYSFTNRKSDYWYDTQYNVFVSIEPILEPVNMPDADWIIVGAETGRRKNKVIPHREWIANIESICKMFEIPLFMKSSLADIWGEPLVQEFPFEKLNKNT